MPGYAVVLVAQNGDAIITTTIPDDLVTAQAYALANGGEVVAKDIIAAINKSAVSSQVTALQTENNQLKALLPANENGTTYITVSEYRWHLAGVYQGLALLVTGNSAPTQAQVNQREKWRWVLSFLESLDQARRVNTKTAPILQITNLAFADGFITQAKRDFLNNL